MKMSASTSPPVLVLGAGANIGASLARTFAAKGLSVALAARKMEDETNKVG
jgi:NADP-dependent 3-hydroxy acid dehydrogenase YdfG